MTRCGSCGVDAGFPVAICPSCGARAEGRSSPKEAPDGRTVLANEATVGPSREAGAATGCFFVVDGQDRGRQFLITRTSLVGRGHGADIDLNDPRVSLRHAHLHVEGDRVVYQDLEATNGSYLAIRGERKKLRGPHTISDGDEIILGNTTLRYIHLKKGTGK